LIRMYSDDSSNLEQAIARPEEGTLTWVCGLMMHAKAAQPDKAHELKDVPGAGKFMLPQGQEFETASDEEYEKNNGWIPEPGNPRLLATREGRIFWSTLVDM